MASWYLFPISLQQTKYSPRSLIDIELHLGSALAVCITDKLEANPKPWFRQTQTLGIDAATRCPHARLCNTDQMTDSPNTRLPIAGHVGITDLRVYERTYFTATSFKLSMSYVR